MILRRLDLQPEAARCSGGHHCPAVFEMTTGDFAIIGVDITVPAVSWLPPGSGCGPNERIVNIPRRTLVLARPRIPDTL